MARVGPAAPTRGRGGTLTVRRGRGGGGPAAGVRGTRGNRHAGGGGGGGVGGGRVFGSARCQRQPRDDEHRSRQSPTSVLDKHVVPLSLSTLTHRNGGGAGGPAPSRGGLPADTAILTRAVHTRQRLLQARGATRTRHNNRHKSIAAEPTHTARQPQGSLVHRHGTLASTFAGTADRRPRRRLACGQGGVQLTVARRPRPHRRPAAGAGRQRLFALESFSTTCGWSSPARWVASPVTPPSAVRHAAAGRGRAWRWPRLRRFAEGVGRWRCAAGAGRVPGLRRWR